MRMNKQQGFTLVEMMLSLGLLAVVLAAMAAFISPTLKQLYRVEGQLESTIFGEAAIDYLRDKFMYAQDICISSGFFDNATLTSSLNVDQQSALLAEGGYWGWFLDAENSSWLGDWNDADYNAVNDEDLAVLLREIANTCPAIVPDLDTGVSEDDPVYLPFFRFQQSVSVRSLHITVEPLSTKTMYVTVTVKDQKGSPDYTKTIFVECFNAEAIHLFLNGAVVEPTDEGLYVDIEPITDGYMYVDIIKGLTQFDQYIQAPPD